MTRDITQEIKGLIDEKLGIGLEKITDKSTMDSLGADSLDQIELIMKIEDQYNLKIPDEDADGLKTIGDMVNYISKHYSEEKKSPA